MKNAVGVLKDYPKRITSPEEALHLHVTLLCVNVPLLPAC